MSSQGSGDLWVPKPPRYTDEDLQRALRVDLVRADSQRNLTRGGGAPGSIAATEQHNEATRYA